MKKLYIRPLMAATIVSFSAATALADAPQGYYNSLNGKKEGDLKTAVHNLIYKFTQVSSYQALPQYFQRTDVYPESNRWWDMYSDIPFYAPSFSGLNREHSFPKSWWGGLTGVPAYVDLNHLYPSEARANQAKSNYPLGEVAPTVTPSFDNGIVKVGNPVTGQGGTSSTVFEPNDEYKGDFARTYFYMVTCYQDLTWATKYMWMMNQNTYPTLKGWAIDLLLKWHRQDPVSEKELDRNDEVYKIQNNRNPFIDRPALAEYIWGNKVGEAYQGGSADEPVGDPELTTPVQGMSLDFGQVAIGKTTTSQLFFHGANLTGTITLTLTGADKKMFALPSNSIRASLVNQAEGYWLTITYNPQEIGEHTARLIISDGGMEGSRGIALRGECLEVPTLTACTATEATDITSDSYRANWTYPEDEVIDYWVVTRTKYVNGNATIEEVLAEEPGIIIDGFGESDQEAYSVQSVRLGFRSPASNVIFVSHSGITGVEADQEFVVQGFEGFMRFLCSAPHTGVCIYDIAGRMVMFLDTATDNMDVDIPTGIYFISTDQHSTPVKVAVK